MKPLNFISHSTDSQTGIYWMNNCLPLLFADARLIPLTIRSVLEIGPGRGMTGRALRIYRPGIERLEAIEAWGPYVRDLMMIGDYDHIEHGQVEYSDLVHHNQYDLVLCLEVLEHLDKADALWLLGQMKVAGRNVVLTTPARFTHQIALDGNPYQVHKCRITVKDLKERGYEVQGWGNVCYAPINSRILQRRVPGWHKHLIARYSIGGR